MSDKVFRSYEIVRDNEGMPTRLLWNGDYRLPALQAKAERDQKKLEEYQRIYGKRKP
jgi:hypothetical protein